jgi:hypothetical protein
MIRFLRSEGVKTGEIYGRMTLQCGSNYISQENVYEWMERFEEWRTNDRYTRSEWPPTITRVEVKELIDQRIRDNRTINTYGTAFEISMRN